jgi:hypothetical protein
LKPEDFKPRGGSDEDRNRWLTATKALQHWEQFHTPIGDMITAELASHGGEAKLGDRRIKLLRDYAKGRLTKRVTVPLIEERLLDWKKQVLRMGAMEEMIQLEGSGEMTDEKFLELCRDAVRLDNDLLIKAKDYYVELEDRIARREIAGDEYERFPALMIDPLDQLVRAISRGHLGLVIAPWKRGKSLLLLWIAIAYTLQRLNVLYITLEDKMDDVEDRLDACAAQMPITSLGSRPRLLRKRFKQFVRIPRGKLKIIDATERSLSVAKIEELFEAERELGFVPDCVIIDYDDEIKAKKKHEERRFEFAEIYRDLRRFCAKQNILLWTAAQTKRNTEDLKILTGDDLAEDISKIRKVNFALTMGKGEWGEDSIYLHVAAHKHDKQHVGCNIMSNKDEMTIYERDLTIAMMKQQILKEYQAEQDGEVPPKKRKRKRAA